MTPDARDLAHPPDDEIDSFARDVVRGSPLALEVLRFYAGNPFALLPVADLALRLLRETADLMPVLERFAGAGYVRAEGRGPIFVLTRDRALRERLASLARFASTPDGRLRLLSGKSASKAENGPREDRA